MRNNYTNDGKTYFQALEQMNAWVLMCGVFNDTLYQNYIAWDGR
jgi:hypothetical protein